MIMYILLSGNPPFNGPDDQAILNKVLTIEVEALKETNNMLEPAIFMRALHLLSKTTHIDFYAMDNNLDIANMGAASFIMANKRKKS